MRVAAHEARMRTPDKQGIATRTHYEGIVRRAALTHGEGSAQHEKSLANLEGPDVPDEVAYLWGWFRQLDGRRASGMNGPDPISHREIQAWADLYGRSPDALELDALCLLDAITRNPDAFEDDADG